MGSKRKTPSSGVKKPKTDWKIFIHNLTSENKQKFEEMFRDYLEKSLGYYGPWCTYYNPTRDEHMKGIAYVNLDPAAADRLVRQAQPINYAGQEFYIVRALSESERQCAVSVRGTHIGDHATYDKEAFATSLGRPEGIAKVVIDNCGRDFYGFVVFDEKTIADHVIETGEEKKYTMFGLPLEVSTPNIYNYHQTNSNDWEEDEGYQSGSLPEAASSWIPTALLDDESSDYSSDDDIDSLDSPLEPRFSPQLPIGSQKKIMHEIPEDVAQLAESISNLSMENFSLLQEYIQQGPTSYGLQLWS